MITLRPSAERGSFDFGWLDTRHSFSFGDYFDPAHMGFRTLRVINEDLVAPGTGFGMHPHRDMEIVTWILEGALEHSDSMGNGSVIRPGDAQRMSAGTGVMHGEKNPSATERVHLLQIWILPIRRGIEPGYEQISIPERELAGQLRVIASPTGESGGVTIHQDARILAARLSPGERVEHSFAAGRAGWIQVAKGAVEIGDVVRLVAGDGASIEHERTVAIRATERSELLLFDLR
jgi:redox-sensitive bicupin YhaK (pirin superfamily)